MSRSGAGHREGWSPVDARGARPAIVTTSPAAGGVTYVRMYVLSTLRKNVWSLASLKNFSGAGTAFVAGVGCGPVPALADGACDGAGVLPCPRHGAMATAPPPWWSVIVGGTTFEKSPPAGR